MNRRPPLQRTDLLDTSLAAHLRQIECLRRLAPEEKVRLSFEMMESLRKLREAAEADERLRGRRGV
jgi:hypothetical protein